MSGKAFGAASEASGSKVWSRSKLMAVGEGAAGKTVTFASLQGKDFEVEHKSTCGTAIAQLEVEARGKELTQMDWKGWKKFEATGSEQDTFIAEIIMEMESLMPLTKATPGDGHVIKRLGDIRKRLKKPWEELGDMGFDPDCIANAKVAEGRAKQALEQRERREQEAELKLERDQRASAQQKLDALRNAAAVGVMEKEHAAKIARDAWKLRKVLKCGLEDLVERFPDSVASELRRMKAEEQRKRDLRTAARLQGEEEEEEDSTDEGELTAEEQKRLEAARKKKAEEAVRLEAARKKQAEEVAESTRRLEDLVLQMKERGGIDSRLVLSVWDFGGQVVFAALHHLFLTPYGGYMIVFNMQKLLDPSTAPVSFQHLDYWLRSLQMHAPGAPVFLVGTRADAVPPEDRVVLSERINKRYFGKPFFISREDSGTIVWPDEDAVHGQLVFFAVNNCESSSDPFIQSLQRQIEVTLANESYVKDRVPCSWLTVFDKLTQHAKAMGDGAARPIISRKEVRQHAIDSGITAEDADEQVDAMLKLFHELGQFIYFPDSELRDLVILDPQWLIDAVSRIIRIYDTEWNRKKYGAGAEAVIKSHSDVRDSRAKLKHPTQWEMLTHTGILGDALAAKLWSSITEAEGALVTADMLHYLLAKFGLTVPLRGTSDGGGAEAISFLVPSLLPPARTTSDAKWTSCFIIFEDATGKYDTSPNSNDNIRQLSSFNDGFLPNGLFARLLAKLVDWSQNTGGGGANQYYANHAKLFFCGQLEMECHLDVLSIGGADGGLSARCIQVRLNKLNAGPMMDRIESLLQKIEAECMKRLNFHVAANVSVDVARTDLGAGAGGAPYVIGLTALKSLDSDKPLYVDSKPSGLRKTDLESCRKAIWDVSPSKKDPDVFLSYRHASDSDFAQQLYDRLCFGKLPDEVVRDDFFSVGAEGRRMKVFFTKEEDTLRVGEQFDSQLVNAIDSSLVVVPIVSAPALKSMIAQPIDYLLLEWQIAAIIAGSKGAGESKLAVLPIVVPDAPSVGAREHKDTLADACHGGAGAATSLLDQLESNAPNVVPKETVTRMLTLLHQQYPGAQLPPSAGGWRRTARQTVHNLLHGIQQPEVLHGSSAAVAVRRQWDLVEAAAQSVFKLVSARVKEDPWHAEKSATGVSRAVQEHSKALAKSPGARSAEEERKILSDAHFAAGQRSFAITTRELQAYNEQYGGDEFIPPSKNHALAPILAAFKLLRDRLSERAADHHQGLGAEPELTVEERDVFRRCEEFVKAFLLAYVRFCVDERNSGLLDLMLTDSEAKKRRYKGTYQAQVQENIGTEADYEKAIAAAARLQAMPSVPMPTAPRDLSTFMGTAAIAQERVSGLIQDFANENRDTTTRTANLKVAYRVIEKALKSMSGPLEQLHEQWSYEKANDCARGGIECHDMKQCTACLEWFAELHTTGKIALLKVKDRYTVSPETTGPTDGGWSDFLVMFLFPDGGGQNIPCEIQIVHEKLFAARKTLGAHEAYDGFRAACETLALVKSMQGAASVTTAVPAPAVVLPGELGGAAAAAGQPRVPAQATATAEPLPPAVASNAQRLTKLEEEALGEAKEGGLIPRLKALEQELMGAAQVGPMQARIEALEADVLC
jgi:GTPase SAR1 family protein